MKVLTFYVTFGNSSDLLASLYSGWLPWMESGMYERVSLLLIY